MSPEPAILAVSTAVPPHRVAQAEAKEFARALFSASHRDIDRLLPLFDNVRVEGRNFCVPREWFERDHSFPEKNALYEEWALELSEKAARRVLDRAGVGPEEVGAIFLVSSTGLSTPSLDSRLIFRLGLSPHVRRVPVWGLGCAGGAAGLALAAGHVRSRPGQIVLLVAVELCGLTFVRGDLSKSNLVATSLFADGAAAVLLGEGEGPRVIGGHSTVWPGTEDVMGWDVVEEGLKVRFARSVPRLVEERMAQSVEAACRACGLEARELRHHLLHPGGAKVIEAYGRVLEVGARELELSLGVLREFGNMSSATVLFVLERFLEDYPAGSGEAGIVSALGPGFAAEHALFRC
ncbi:chalcone synthase [Rubrobacter xylanophilus]|uniref:Chalcone synthase n=1 Tax=Rubrobacter xylanophilus TaxID=49319 RepID=A0A510HF34_9ACTN|nr:3-oxoacyl-[acyl-carrier-protein] synthase III C-terminal domain-containing protein [Rubrobacter xylanophilus]BBL78538.1 chalcone synthase [Rubrobacter xylanophilus]